MSDDVVDFINRKPPTSRGVEGMESVVATVSGYHGTNRFNLIKLINQTGANYVGNMSKSITHLVCWKFEGKKYDIAKKFKTMIVSPKWFEECARTGKRVPEDRYLMKCGEEDGLIHFEGLLMQKENIKTKAHSNILAHETNRSENSEKLKNIYQDWDARNDTSLSCSELDTSPLTSGRLESAALKQRKSKDKPSSSKNHSSALHLSVMVGDKGLEPSSSDLRHSQRRKRDTIHTPLRKISTETSSKGRKLVKKNPARRILGYDISDSDEDCYVVETSRHELEAKEEHVDLSTNLSPQKISLPDDSVLDNQENQNGEMVYTSQHNKSTKHPISSEPSCAICWTDFSLVRGILQCGHRYCYPCIQNWSDQLVSKGKVSTCPLCKENFHSILKVDDAGASDQKMYSQTIPCAPLMRNVSLLPIDRPSEDMTPFLASRACMECSSSESEEFLISCYVCQNRCVHHYCLDPPVYPWVCVHCRDLRNIFHRG